VAKTSATSVTSVYGAAGSIVIVLLWVYYSSQVVLFGAEFTRVYAKHRGAFLKPKENTMRVIRKKHNWGIPRLSDQQSHAIAFRDPYRTIILLAEP
jgi:membrane protein